MFNRNDLPKMAIRPKVLVDTRYAESPRFRCAFPYRSRVGNAVMSKSSKTKGCRKPKKPHKDAKQRVNGCIAAVAHRFTDERVVVDTTTGNAARIWKVYGTVAAKGDSMAERPHAMARTLLVPDRVIPASHDLFERLAASAPTTADVRRSVRVNREYQGPRG